ncbi:hypothetical protein HK099_008420 [Clydaea vesicula]|uniref:Uncharacterized protein n=1 Tax=Clydaea vesicula TaxID=447962 RepID=A0AAD5U942_9FUNG|nr:hypothetical protein HK099_008420 [Clydaea vesicula]
MSESQKFVESFIAELTSAKIFKERVKDKVLLFDNKNVLTDKQEMKELKRKRKKLNKFNSKEKKKLKLYHFEKDTLRYETFLDLHSLWSQYMAELLGDNLQKNAVLNKMIKADFHGCYMKGNFCCYLLKSH